MLSSNGHKLDWVFSTGSVCPYSVNLFMFQGLWSWAMNSVHWTHTTPSRYCCLEYTRAVQPERIAYPSSPIRSMLATLDPEFPFLMWKSTFSPATWWQTFICIIWCIHKYLRMFSHLEKLNRLAGLVGAHRGNVVFQNTPESNNWVLNENTKVNRGQNWVSNFAI